MLVEPETMHFEAHLSELEVFMVAILPPPSSDTQLDAYIQRTQLRGC